MAERVPGPRDTAVRVGRLLTIGTYVSVALALVGVVLVAAQGTDPLHADPPAFDLARVPAQLADGDPAGFLWAALLASVALPSARVALAATGFVAEGDRRQAAIALAVLCVLGISVAVALAGR